MPTTVPYNREKALAYAEKWAFGRNPRYFQFDGIGGDCTNFISQCLFAGSGIMNYTPDTGWYYNSPTDRAAAWSGVPYLHKFLVNNRSVGPFASEAGEQDLIPGDIVQLGNAAGKWYHSLFVTDVSDGILIATHTFDAYNRPLSSYSYAHARYLHIEGVRRW